MSASRAAILLGTLGVLAIPVAVALAWVLANVALLTSTEVGVPVGFALGFYGLLVARG